MAAVLLLDCENVYYSPSKPPPLVVTKPFPERNELMVDTIYPLPRCRCRHSILYNSTPSIIDMSSPSDGRVVLFFSSPQTLLHYLLYLLCKQTETTFSIKLFSLHALFSSSSIAPDKLSLDLEHLSIYLFREILKFKILGSNFNWIWPYFNYECFNVENNPNSDGLQSVCSIRTNYAWTGTYRMFNNVLTSLLRTSSFVTTWCERTLQHPRRFTGWDNITYLLNLLSRLQIRLN